MRATKHALYRSLSLEASQARLGGGAANAVPYRAAWTLFRARPRAHMHGYGLNDRAKAGGDEERICGKRRGGGQPIPASRVRSSRQ